MQNFSLAAFSARAAALLLIVSLAACNSDGTASSTTAEQSLAPVAAVAAAAPVAAASMSAVNIAPTLSGAPATTASLGAVYSFTPAATDVNSDALTFSIQNLPTWATFNPATGQLVGTPDTAGVSANILISVSDGQGSSRLAPFAITVSAPGSAPSSGSAGSAGSAQVSWSVPTVNADGSALTDLAGFHVYYGTDPARLTRVDVQGATSVSYTAANLTPGTYYFTVAAYNAAGVESAQPTVVSTLIG